MVFKNASPENNETVECTLMLSLCTFCGFFYRIVSIAFLNVSHVSSL